MKRIGMSLFGAIQEVFSMPLPGEDAHLPLSPISRMRSSEALAKATKFKESAVGVHLFESESKLEILLTQRSSYDGVHSGQICFPGGKVESHDVDSLDTARRESFEETGIPVSAGVYVGNLTEVFIPVSHFRVYPHVFFHSEKQFSFQTQEREVRELIWLPHDDLLDNDILSTTDIHFDNGSSLKDVPCFVYQEKIIWGATAIMLNELKEILKRL